MAMKMADDMGFDPDHLRPSRPGLGFSSNIVTS